MKRIVCFLILLSLLACSVAVPAGAAEKEQINRDIAIVFDNSWSMYMQENVAWCRATYAMEVFADMMNEGDTMRIYPMHKVEIDGTEYDENKPVTISGPKDAEMIRRMYTIDAQGTPVTTIDAAHDGLKGSRGEPWLIVLTDGTAFAEKNDKDSKELSTPETEKMLSERLSKYIKDMNILYLGIGAGAAMPAVSDSGGYKFAAEKASESSDVLSKLTSMCNMIFGRDTLPVSGDSVSFDVSMKKLIVFVQGKGISNVSVKDAGGSEIGKRIDEQATHFSDKGAGRDGTESAARAVDENLQGMMVTYVSDGDRNMSAGTYVLSYAGEASSVAAYYEPDVDLKVQLLDAAGNEITTNEAAFEGTYTMRYGLWDNQANRMTDSELLGSTHYEVDYTINGEVFHAGSDKKLDEISVDLKANDELEATISAEYLSGYRITKSGPDFGWPLPFKIQPLQIHLENLVLSVTGGSGEYPLSRLEEEGRYHLTAAYEGEPVPADALQVNAIVDGSNIPVEAVPSGDGWDMCLKYNGDPISTDTGDFALTATVTYTNKDGVSAPKTIDPLPFTVINDGYGLAVQIEQTQSYYQISKLDESDPLILHLTKDGEPLSDEELGNVLLTVDAEDLPIASEVLKGQSAIELRLKKEDSLKPGAYTIVAHASAVDPLGQQIEGEDSAKVEVGRFPLWMRWLIISLSAALLLTLLLLFLNTKVLPKKVLRAPETTYTIGGKTIAGNATVKYERAARSLDISPPAAPSYPYVSCGVKLALAPVSPRRVKSGKRKIEITEVRASPDITSVEVGAAVYELDKETGKFAKEGGGKTTISNNSIVTVNGIANDAKGKKRTAILTQQLRFK